MYLMFIRLVNSSIELIDILIIIFHILNSDNFLFYRNNYVFTSFWMEFTENLCYQPTLKNYFYSNVLQVKSIAKSLSIRIKNLHY
jgi:hypothetical protein